jgi:SAM-dependent methyltransferase
VTIEDVIVWHELECGSYRADLALWLALARRHGGPVLDVGAGTGRVTLTLARAGYEVTALDHDCRLLGELERRADALAARSELRRESVEVVVADARQFELSRLYPLIIVPMQTLQLLGGAAGRRAFLQRAAGRLTPAGALAAAIATRLEPFDSHRHEGLPPPDMTRHGDRLYSSQPTAVRRERDGYLLERWRERVSPSGRSSSLDAITIDRVSVSGLRGEAAGAGLRLVEVHQVPATAEHVPSEVVMFNAA